MTKTKHKKEEFSSAALDALLSGHETAEERFGKDGLFKRLQAALIERALVNIPLERNHVGLSPHFLIGYPALSPCRSRGTSRPA